MPHLAVAVVIALAAAAHAEPKVCATKPKDPKPRPMNVVVRDGVLAPAPGSEFPAVTTDGKRMAELFVEADGAGVPITTMEIWEIAGPKEIGYEGLGGKGDDPRAGPVMVKVVNEKLAGTWRPIPVYTPCDPKSPRTLAMGKGLAFSMVDTRDRTAQKLVRTVNGGESTRMRLGFDHLGTTAGTLPDGSGGDACGTVTGIAWGFGGLDEGLAVIVPAGTLGAGCFRSRSAVEANPYLTHGDGG